MKKLSPALLVMLVLALLVLTGCQTLSPAPDGVTPARPAADSSAAWPQGRQFVVNRLASELRLIVRAEGPMARLGHPHVIGGSVIDGEIVLAEPFRNSALRLRIDIDDLRVDPAPWRAAEGFEPEVDEDSIAGTRRNMLSPALLDADAHPEIRIESISISGPRWQPDIEALVTVAGETRQLTVPVAVALDGDSLTATGRFVIRQSDFGLEPYSAAGGALRVTDEVLIRFRIEAHVAD